jgi:hypothetical protein
MQQQLINLNSDLHQIWSEGYDVRVCGGYLLVHHIPYVTPHKIVDYGTLVCPLTLAGPNRIGKPKDHTIHFKGETPCHYDGTPLIEIINNSKTVQLTEEIVVNHYFSSKPRSGKYSDYYEKIRTYSEILSSQAKAIDSLVTSKPHKNER